MNIFPGTKSKVVHLQLSHFVTSPFFGCVIIFPLFFSILQVLLLCAIFVWKDVLSFPICSPNLSVSRVLLHSCLSLFHIHWFNCLINFYSCWWSLMNLHLLHPISNLGLIVTSAASLLFKTSTKCCFHLSKTFAFLNHHFISNFIVPSLFPSLRSFVIFYTLLISSFSAALCASSAMLIVFIFIHPYLSSYFFI